LLYYQVKTVKNEDLEEKLAQVRKTCQPEMVIIDHILDKTSPNSLARLGSTVAGFLREEWKQCPLFGITAVDKVSQIDDERYMYDELMEGDRFSEYLLYIPNVVEGFKQCAEVGTIEEWIALLNAPDEDIERIRMCIPHDVKTDVQKKGFAGRIYRWFRRKFYSMPGFLYDDHWVATFAGVKRDRFDKYVKHFESSEYKGIFNDPGRPRWWKAKLYEAIYGKCKDENAACRSTQDVANEVLRVKEQDRSKCCVCHEKWPETVAYLDQTEKASAKPMHLRCTIAHPLYPYEPMFEEIRMMEGK